MLYAFLMGSALVIVGLTVFLFALTRDWINRAWHRKHVGSFKELRRDHYHMPGLGVFHLLCRAGSSCPR